MDGRARRAASGLRRCARLVGRPRRLCKALRCPRLHGHRQQRRCQGWGWGGAQGVAVGQLVHQAALGVAGLVVGQVVGVLGRVLVMGCDIGPCIALVELR